MAQGSVVVTGASTGIGRACARHLRSLGFDVFAGVRKQADSDSVAADDLTPLIVDVTDADSIAAAAKTVSQAVGDAGLAGLVNNAGMPAAGPIEFLQIEDLRRVLEVNVVGQVAVTQAFLPMVRKATGRVIFIGSVGGRRAAPFLGPYSASKFAIEAITQSLRRELRRWGIEVAVIEPGSVATPIWDKGSATADETLQKLSPEARARQEELYGEAIEALRETVRKTARRAIPPEKVAQKVAHALTARHPKTRYLVGADARAQVAMGTVLPDRLADRVVDRAMGLNR